MHTMSTKLDDWSRQTGEKHGIRDRAAALGAQARIDVEQQRQAGCLERWPAIVAAMNTVVAATTTAQQWLADYRAHRM